MEENKKEKVSKKPVNKGNDTNSTIWQKTQINMYTDFLEILFNNNIIWKESIITAYSNNDIIEPNMLKLLDTLYKNEPERASEIEKEILTQVFKEKFNYEIFLDERDIQSQVSLAISDMFHDKNPQYLGKEIVDKILNSGILPISLKIIDKKNYLEIVSRTPEIPNNLIDILKPIMTKKSIYWVDAIKIVSRTNFDRVYKALTNFEYSNEL